MANKVLAKMTSEEAKYFREAYPEMFGDKLVTISNETDTKKEASLLAEVKKLKAENSALKVADRAIELARKEQDLGLIPSYIDYKAQGMSRKEAREASNQARQAEAQALISLDDNAFEAQVKKITAAHNRKVNAKTEGRDVDALQGVRLIKGMSNQYDNDGDLIERGSDKTALIASAFQSAVDGDKIEASKNDMPKRK